MTDHTTAAQAAKQDPLSEAISILTADAASIRESHTPPCDRDDWNSEPETKAYYDHLLRVAGELSKLRAPVADERAAFEAGWKVNATEAGKDATQEYLDGCMAVDWKEYAQKRSALSHQSIGQDDELDFEDEAHDRDNYLAAQIDERDAQRYRWLRDQNDWYAEPRIDEADGTVWKLTFYTPARIEDPTDDDSLDTAIDAARAALASTPVAGGVVAWEVTNADIAFWTVCRSNDAADDIAAQHREAGYANTVVRPLVYGDAAPQASAEAVRNAALEEAAAALEDHRKAGREWVPGSLWDTLSREAAARIRALKQPQAAKDGDQQRAGDVDDREAWAADMIAAGAKHLGDECWEWESDDFLFHLWQVATGRPHAALAATQPEQGERDA